MLLSSNFVGAFLGGVVGTIILLGLLFVWAYWEERQVNNDKNKIVRLSAEDILEKQLEEYIVQNFSDLFPNWQIFGQGSDDSRNGSEDVDENKGTNSSRRVRGVQYRTSAGNIDILCYDSKGNLVVIELKRDKAPDRVVAQVDRYISWVRTNLAQPGQRVWGLIIAKRFDARLFHILQRRRDIKIWTYEWRLRFDKRPKPS